MGFKRKDIDFYSNKIRCAAWLYLPEEIVNPPVVIMAHGLGAERTFRLPEYAERFTKKGLAVFLFDYRYFGDSQGTPRNLINPYKQLRDWQAAVAHVRTLSGINTSKIALFGTSFSGGHVIVIASRDPDIAAIVSQVPYIDSFSSISLVSWPDMIKGMFYSVKDLFRMLTFRTPYYVPIVADPGTYAFMNTPDARPGYLALVPEGSSWENKVPARLGLTIGGYRPVKVAHKVKCPTLLLLAEEETLISIEMTEKTAAKIPDCTFIRLPGGHFDQYAGDGFERAVEIEGNFLEKTLKN
jgi:pimeloyl-ACP methyl ester carboxylesterase